ncbi:MAG: hypothetical protein ACI8XU_001160 [Kiritimatiellia bacterium]|jgi:hypothetical protein
MSTRRLNLKDDLVWLKWWLILLALSFAIVGGGYWAALYNRGEMRRLEFGTRSNFDVINQEVTQIEESERIIVENIDRFNAMVANRLLDEEDRVSLLEDIRRIRNRLQLFPIDVEVREQSRRVLEYDEGVDYPDEQISVRSSEVLLRIPLLHEEDLTRFLGAFLNTEKLMVTTSCVITASNMNTSETLEIIERQIANCEFVWFTFRRELPAETEEFDDYAA